MTFVYNRLSIFIDLPPAKILKTVWNLNFCSYTCCIVNQTHYLMKKVFLMLVAGAFISMSLVSCSKCGHCEISGVSGTKYCQKDDKSAYDAYESACKAAGGTWKND